MSDSNDNSVQADATSSSQGSKSEVIGQSLDSMRGVRPELLAEDVNLPVGSETERGSEARTADEESAESDAPAEGEEPQDVEAEVAAIQKRLLTTDKARAKHAQDSAYMKGKLAELQPYIDLGISVAKNPQAYNYVRKVLGGETPTAGEAKAAEAAAKVQGVTPGQMRAMIQEALDTHTMASRQFNKIDARARKEIPNYDTLEDHPDYLGLVSAMNEAVKNGSLEVPEDEDRNFFVLKTAQEVFFAKNPAYLKAVKDAGVKVGKESAAKKLVGGLANGASRGSNTTKPKLTQEQSDLLGYVTAWTNGGRGGRRMPSAR